MGQQQVTIMDASNIESLANGFVKNMYGQQIAFTEVTFVTFTPDGSRVIVGYK